MPSFVDTNVLVYAEDRDAGRKHEIARDLIVGLWNNREGVLSVQVLEELYLMLTRKVRRPLAPAKAAEVVREYFAWRVVDSGGDLLGPAMTLHQKGSVSFWDALIVEAAVFAGCDRIYTEDLNSGSRFGALKIVNPFARSRRSGEVD